MEGYKREFIKFLEDAGVLKFGDFTAKSGRKIPYFINAGDIKTGEQIQRSSASFMQRLILKRLAIKGQFFTVRHIKVFRLLFPLQLLLQGRS